LLLLLDALIVKDFVAERAPEVATSS